jgi:hypothetical protein
VVEGFPASRYPRIHSARQGNVKHSEGRIPQPALDLRESPSSERCTWLLTTTVGFRSEENAIPIGYVTRDNKTLVIGRGCLDAK